MALKQLQLRIVSTQNIEKITASMKMVAAAKMKGTENRLFAGRPFGMRTSLAAFPQKEAEEDEFDPSYALDLESYDKHHTLLITSDRGLCGGVNSAVCKAGKMSVTKFTDAGKSCDISIVGDKGRAQMARIYADNMAYTMDETWKNPPSFDQACAVADRVLAVDSEQVNVVFNTFESAIAYNTTWFNCPNFAALAAAKADAAEGDDGVPEYLQDYELEPENKVEALENLYEFSVAGTVFWGMLEGGASEESSRMQAMENASKNAGEIIDKLTLKYNRARQAAITTELIEIISGAAALEG